jgi:hypothetical protein
VGLSMIPVVLSGAAAAAQAATLERFRVADATRPERARSLESLGVSDDAAVARLLRAGVVCPGTATDTLFLDEVALAAYQKSGKGRALAIAFGAMLIAFGIGLALVMVRQASVQLPGR